MAESANMRAAYARMVGGSKQFVVRTRNSESRNELGLAEREGIGVDRMVRDMLAIGRPATVIPEAVSVPSGVSGDQRLTWLGAG